MKLKNVVASSTRRLKRIIWKCVICSKRSFNQSTIFAHIMSDHFSDTLPGTEPEEEDEWSYGSSDVKYYSSSEDEDDSPSEDLSDEEDSLIFCCEYCPMVHYSLDLLQEHSKKHLFFEGSTKCPTCPYFTNNFSCLIGHLSVHASANHMLFKRCKCLSCPYVSNNYSQMRFHCLRHGNKHHFKCLSCDYSASCSIFIKLHLIIHYMEKRQVYM